MKKLLGISLVAMMAVTSARADIASKAYVDVSENGNVVLTTNTAGQNIKALDAKLGALPADKTAAEAIADAVSGASTAYQAKSGAAYNLGNATGGWTALTADEQAALGSGIDSTKVAQIATNAGDITTLKGDASTAGSVAKAVKDASDAINATIGSVPSTSDSVVDYVDDKVAAAGADTTALANRVTTAEGKITTAEGNITTLQGDVTDLENDKADKATTLAGYGIADAYTKTEADGKYQTLDNLATSSTWATDKSSDTKYASAKAVDTAITAVSGDVSGLDTRLTTAEGDIDDLEATVGDSTTGLAATKAIADSAKATADAAIPAPTGECTNATNKCVLTYNNSTYAWEVIARGTGE